MTKAIQGILLILILGSAWANLAAQNTKIDSLHKVLASSKADTGRVNTLNALSRQLFQTGRYDTSLSLALGAKELSEKLSFGKGVAAALNNIGNVHYALGSPDEALKDYQDALLIQEKLPPTRDIKKGIAASHSNIGNVYVARGGFEDALKHYRLSLKIREDIDDQQGIAICYSNFGVIYYSQGNYPEALRNYLVALRIEKKMNDEVAIARTYNNTGNIYVQMADYPKAAENYSSALEMQTKINDKAGIGRSYNNLGNVFFLQKNYTLALKYFSDGLLVKKEVGDKNGMARAYDNIGNIYFTQSLLDSNTSEEKHALFDKACKSFLEALSLFESIGDKQGLALTCNNLGEINIHEGKLNEAGEYLAKGLKNAKEARSKFDIKSSFRGLAALDSARGNWKDAFLYHQSYILYRDSILSEENTKKVVQDQMNFDFGQKELRMQAEQEQKDMLAREKTEREKIIGWSVSGIIGLIFLSLLLLLNRSKLKQKNNYQQKLNQQQMQQAVAVMETQELERKRIAEDIHDSLGHLLSTAKLNLQALPEDQQPFYNNTLQLLNQASQEIRTISYNLMPQTLEEEGLVPALYELAEKIRRSRLYDIMLQVHDMDNLDFDKQTKFNIYRIVQEAVSNILKHADAKEINIQLIKQEEHLSIVIEDDGKGFDVLHLKHPGRGLKNITARSEWLHGTITIDSTPGRGTTIAIEIPLKTKIG